MRILLALIALALASCNTPEKPSAPATNQVSAQSASPANTYSTNTRVGFHSRQQFDQHFAKHGGEFGGITKAEYLREAQQLRDRPVGGDVEEIIRRDGTVSRYDRQSGAFLAFNRDGTIRTFFKPNNGERYFRRQAQRSH